MYYIHYIFFKKLSRRYYNDELTLLCAVVSSTKNAEKYQKSTSSRLIQTIKEIFIHIQS